MNKTQEKLEKETRKWKKRLKNRLENTEIEDPEIENAEAYLSDTEHFLQEQDYIRAWEAVIYGWGIIETLERIENREQK